jgi:SAM-dependent methyltransferase
MNRAVQAGRRQAGAVCCGRIWRSACGTRLPACPLGQSNGNGPTSLSSPTTWRGLSSWRKRPPPPPGAALDVGVGYGYSAAALRAARPGEELWCLAHPSLDVRFSSAWRDMLAVCGCRAILSDAGALPFRSGVFSVVCAAELIEHLSPERLPSVLVEMVRVLRPGGVLVVTTPNLARLWNRLALLRGRPFLTSATFRIGSTYGHLREYT